MALKLAAILAAAAPFLAADKKPEELKAAIIAADKAAKDANTGLGPKELEEKDKPKAQDKSAKDKAAKDKAAKDKGAKDKDDDPEGTNDVEMEAEDGEKDDMDAKDKDDMDGEDEESGVSPQPKGKTAVDSADVDRRIAAAVGARDALHTALREVEPILGRVAFDSAGKAYRAALEHLKVDVKGVPNSALPAMLRLAKDRGVSAPATAMDSAGAASLSKLIKGYDRLR